MSVSFVSYNVVLQNLLYLYIYLVIVNKKLSRNRMNNQQQMRLLELVEKNADILITDNDPQTDDRLKEVRSVFWDMATKLLNKMGEESGKYKDQQGWRKVMVEW